MNRTLKIATWNADRLIKHLQEIKTFIFSQNINILLVFKTYLTNKNYRISGCTFYYTMYPDAKIHGGTTLIILDIMRLANNKKNTCRLLVLWL